MAHYSRKLVMDTFSEGVLNKNFKVRDAKRGLRVTTTSRDCQLAVPRDPCLCVFGQAFKRLHIPALIFRTVAYVARNKNLVEKFQVDSTARAVILANDLVVGERREALKGLAGLTIKLLPPTGCRHVGFRKHNTKPGGKARSGMHSSKEVVATRRHTYELLKPFSRAEN